jgi:hypothetical protein
MSTTNDGDKRIKTLQTLFLVSSSQTLFGNSFKFAPQTASLSYRHSQMEFGNEKRETRNMVLIRLSTSFAVLTDKEPE